MEIISLPYDSKSNCSCEGEFKTSFDKDDKALCMFGFCPGCENDGCGPVCECWCDNDT